MKKDKEIVKIPNEFLFDSFTKAMSIHNFMTISEILERVGMIEDKKEWRDRVTKEWLKNIKKYMQMAVNSYSKHVKSAKNKNPTSVEDFQYNSNKTLMDFKGFLDSILVEKESDENS